MNVLSAAGAGLVLADTLAAHVQGHRPVTLTGFSLGARVVFAALEDLATRPEPVVGVVQDVYLFGAPVTTDPARWQRIRCVTPAHIGGAGQHC
jgi:dienelactone hydrolase